VQLVRIVEALGDDANAGHTSQAPAPVSFLKVPAAHGSHAVVALTEPVKPAAHRHEATDAPPASDPLFAGHITHAPPPTGVYSPAPHDWQVPPFAPCVPAAHAQSVASALPAGETELAAQFTHAAAALPTCSTSSPTCMAVTICAISKGERSASTA